jgi:YHS domain-containing protein
MEGLFSFLLFAVLFYFMMRFGCGSHMAHGHHGNKKLVESIADPVCGLKIGEQESYGKLQDGVLFRFCSKKCLAEFDQNPEKYISQSISKKLREYRDET